MSRAAPMSRDEFVAFLNVLLEAGRNRLLDSMQTSAPA